MTARGASHTMIIAAWDQSAVLAPQAVYACLFSKLHSLTGEHVQPFPRQVASTWLRRHMLSLVLRCLRWFREISYMGQ